MDKISRLTGRIAGYLVFFAACLISLDVIFRKLFNSTLFESLELSSYAFACAVSLSMAWALFTKAHIRIEVLYVLTPNSARKFLDLIAIWSLLLSICVLLYWAVDMTSTNWELGVVSNTPREILIAIPQIFWVLGLVWFAIAAAYLCIVATVRIRDKELPNRNWPLTPPSIEDAVIETQET